MRTFICLATTVALLAVPCSSCFARNKVYRCELDDGHTSYQQIPCHSASQPMKLDGRPSGRSGLRPGERELLDSYRRKDAAGTRRLAAPATGTDKQRIACSNRRKQLEALRVKARRGYTLKESEQLHRERDDHADYLRRFCR